MSTSQRSSAFIPYPLHGDPARTSTPAPATAESAAHMPPIPPRRRHLQRWLWILGSIVVLLILARLALPGLLCSYLNRQLDGLDDYQGHIDAVSMSLYRGAFQLRQVRLVSRPGIAPGLVASCPDVDITLIWRRLLRRQIVASITVYRPQVEFSATEVPVPHGSTVRSARSTVTPTRSWQQRVEALPPLLITEVQVVEASLAYRDAASGFHAQVGRLNIGLTNLTNTAAISTLHNRIVSAKITGDVLGHGQLDIDGESDPFPPLPDFTVHVSLQHCELPAYNLLLQEFAHIDLKHGTLSCYAEMQCQDGHLVGYLKPLLTDIATDSIHESRKKELAVIKEVVVHASNAVLRNHPKRRFAGKIPLSGNLTDPKTSTWATVVSILGNGFIKALEPGFDHAGKGEQAPPLQEPARATDAVDQAKAKAQEKAP